MLSKAPAWYRDCLLTYLVGSRGLSRQAAIAHIGTLPKQIQSRHQMSSL
jgi:hypothetical protein